MGHIYIESKTIAETGHVFNHLYLVYRDDAGNEYVIRGGSENDDIFDFGQIVIENNVAMEDSDDNRGEDTPSDRGQVELDLNGRSAEEVWQDMQEIAAQIENGDYNYEGSDNNSNSVIRTILRGTAIAPTLPSNTTEYFLPGWDDFIPISDADGDGIPNVIDPEPFGPDMDGDAIPDFEDWDKDGDFIPDVFDTDPNGPNDLDDDGTPDAQDEDIDGDGIPNGIDPTPNGDAPPPPPPNTPPPAPGSPLILDLDGDGVETVGMSSNIHFDHGGDSFRELTGFVASDDGLLAIDLNGDGRITTGAELFGNETLLEDGSKSSNGYQALSIIDSNLDGVIDASDNLFSSLRVWRDINQDGVSDPGELFTLNELGVQSLSLSYTSQAIVDEFGNEHRQVGSYTNTAGQSRTMTDVWFSRNLTLTEEDTIEVTAEISALPNALGFGNVHSLHQAMARDTSGDLQALVSQFVNSESRQERQALVEKIIFSWTGQEGDYSGYYQSIIDSRRIGALEAFYGYEVDKPNGTGGQYAVTFNGVFQELVDTVFYQLAAHSYLQPFFKEIRWTMDEASGVWLGDFSLVFDDLFRFAEENPIDARGILLDFAQAIRGVNVYNTINISRLSDSLNEFVGRVDLSDYSDNAISNVIWSITFGATGINYLYGSSGNDTLTSDSGDDQLEGGTGNDVLSGGRGSDLYLFNLGDGQDVITDDNFSYVYGGVDVLRFGAGIQAADITASRSGTSLVLSHSNGSDQVTISNWFTENSGRYQLERIEFANGDVWTSAALSAQFLQLTGGDGDDVLTSDTTAFSHVLTGGGGNDTLTSGTGDDQLKGGTGNDMLNGGRGSDLYLFDLGDGQDVINDDNVSYMYGGVDVLRFGAGIQAADITASRSGTSLVLSHSNGSDQVTISNWFTENSGRYQLERIEFADGGVWTSAALSAQLLQLTGGDGNDVLTGITAAFSQVLAGGGGNDTLTSGTGDDQLKGGTGNDVLNGDRGSDLYLFNLGDGQDVINDDNVSYMYGGVDVLRFGAGIQAADITASRSGTSLVLSHSNGSDQVTISNWFTENSGRYQLERIEFANGVLWNSSQVTARASTDGNDVIIGASTNDRLQGGKGNDYLQGGDGSDTYVFAAGDGQDSINNLSNTLDDVDTLSIEGIANQNLWFSRESNNLVIDVIGSEDRITVQDWYTNTAQRIDVIQADSSALYANAVNNLVNAMAEFGAPAGGEVSLTQDQSNQLNTVIAANWQ